jgi:hypothetical protein
LPLEQGFVKQLGEMELERLEIAPTKTRNLPTQVKAIKKRRAAKMLRVVSLARVARVRERVREWRALRGR